MKKYIFLIFIFVLFSGFPVSAEGKTIFSVKGVEASSGSRVKVSIHMSNSSSYEMISMKLPVDTEKLEFLDCTINGFSKAMLQECSVNLKNELVFYALTMYTEEDKLLTDSGNILDIYFQVKDEVKEDIPLTLTVMDYGKNEMEPLDYEVINDSIKINKNIVVKPTNSSENLQEELKKSNDKNIIWKSSNKDVATVDKEGNVEFRSSGNTTITAKDGTGRILYEKTYFVEDEIPKNRNGFVIVGVVLGILFIGIILLVLFMKKRKVLKKAD